MVDKRYSGKVDQLTLASGGSEHAYSYCINVVISCGNKMNFSSFANMAGFCSDILKIVISYV